MSDFRGLKLLQLQKNARFRRKNLKRHEGQLLSSDGWERKELKVEQYALLGRLRWEVISLEEEIKRFKEQN
tara:strand:- start:1326 stop:1538 length:213 start_codon:yes stop_codon:yes gene_type:complete